VRQNLLFGNREKELTEFGIS